MDQNKSSPPVDSISLAIWVIGSLLGKTWRPQIVASDFCNPLYEKGFPRIFCFWHSNLLPITYFFRNTGKTAVVSQSKDGVRAAAVANLWKTDIIFGSSSRGGLSALRQCLRVLRLNRSVAITPDGPRGPREVVKAGVAQLALSSQAPVITISALPQNAWYLNSWDKFMIPKPFTRIKVLMSEQILPGEFAESADPVESLRLHIQERLQINGKMA